MPAKFPETKPDGVVGFTYRGVTGGSAVLGGSVPVTKNALITGNVLLGSTTGVSPVPAFDIQGKYYAPVPAQLKKLLPGLFGGDLPSSAVLGTGIDRDMALGRGGRLRVYAGAELRSKENDGTYFWSVMAGAESGMGFSSGFFMPYLAAMAEAKGEVCVYLDEKKTHALCGEGRSKATLGLVQASLEANVGGGYRFKVSDNPSHLIRNITVGPQAGFGVYADPATATGFGNAGAVITIR